MDINFSSIMINIRKELEGINKNIEEIRTLGRINYMAVIGNNNAIMVKVSNPHVDIHTVSIKTFLKGHKENFSEKFQIDTKNIKDKEDYVRWINHIAQLISIFYDINKKTINDF
tara:strand:- start:1648 stop:1989 length:342 start_codon:yes stop_codon:yes gene_type:complete